MYYHLPTLDTPVVLRPQYHTCVIVSFPPQRDQLSFLSVSREVISCFLLSLLLLTHPRSFTFLASGISASQRYREPYHEQDHHGENDHNEHRADNASPECSALAGKSPFFAIADEGRTTPGLAPRFCPCELLSSE